MAKKPTDPKLAAVENDAPEAAIPPKPPLPSKDGRRHRATYAKDKYERGYNIRVVGPDAWKMGRRWLPVTRMDGSEAMEFTLERLWKGTDDETGQPVALFALYKQPRETLDEIPF